jgi:RHS repeat-associated protein
MNSDVDQTRPSNGGRVLARNLRWLAGAGSNYIALAAVMCWLAATTAMAAAPLSENPTEKELRQARFFSEPLVPVGGVSPDQNRRLAAALKHHASRAASDDFSALEQFLATHADSPWAGALWVNLGTEYYNTGWYSKALGAWETAWPLLKNAADPNAKALGDHAAGELAYMYGRLGRMAELAALLDSVEGRVFIGSATEKISGAKQGLWTMRNRPEIAFKCGPYALEQILLHNKSTNAGSRLLHEAASTTNGLSLSEVAALSRQVGMNYQMAFRRPGASLVLPAVVNWRLGHYAALVREENGLYLVQDPTFGNDTWMSRRALEAEASGYFLVPPGKLPPGWRTVSDTEGARVFGKGQTSTSDPKATTGCDKKSGCASSPLGAMAQASTHLMLVSLNIEDMPVSYRPPVGYPIGLRVTYNQREANQPALFSYSNFGPKWTFNWFAYILDNPSSPSANVDFYTTSGGALPFTGFNTNTQTYLPQVKTQARLQRTSTNSYEMTLRDGSKLVFDLPGSVGGTSRRVFMTQMIDPQGNAVQIGFDGSFRVTTLTDAIGQVTTFSYEHPSDTLKVTKVTDPFGRFATFAYDGSDRLSLITDPVGITSQFNYDAGDFIQSMTTPYGTTSFEKGESGRTRWLVTTYPNGEKERVEYNETPAATGIAVSEPAVPAGMGVVNNYLHYRNTFFWNRDVYARFPNDYSKAYLYHWQHQGSLAGSILESERPALEGRVWYTYDGQSVSYNEGTSGQPNAIGRVLDDGTTQLYQFQYNTIGQITNSVDPLGRSVSFIYSSNLVDLLEIRQTTGANNELIASYLYDAQHRPTAIYDAAGQLTTNTYNARGQLLTTTNPKGETTALTYDANGYLLAINGALGGTNDSVLFSYDSAGRVRSMTDPDGYTITNRYDNLDRITNVAFPDGTFVAFTYDKLDRVKSTDRLGRETQFTYDTLRRLTSVKDALNRIVRLEYCDCGSLSTLIDALGRPTRWEYDIQGRLAAKQYPNGDRVLYTYESATGRLKFVRDERGQIKQFDYNGDNSLRRIAYPVAQVATPAVNFTYDTNYGRLLTRQDGIGTTVYSYHPAGVLGALQPATVDGPWANDTATHQYDALGRLTNRVINGAAVAEIFDAVGRTAGIINPLGAFSYTYAGPTTRVTDSLYPNGQTTHFDYFNNLGDRRLQQITHRKPDNSLISRFAYARNAIGSITNWVQELGGLTNSWSIGRDAADQLLAVQASLNGTNTSHSFAYDAAGNRLSESEAGTNRTFQYNLLNQLSTASDTLLTNVTYEWDAENRLAAINAGSNRTEFGYDGAGRRCRIVEKTNGVLQSERRYVWCVWEIAEERDASDTVLRRFFSQGFSASGTNYFYTRDHLRSLREVVDGTGQIQSRYAYGPYGAQIKLQENVPAAFGYTGHFRHDQSGLSLTLARPLHTGLGRWLAREPLGESVGPNLYAYVGNDPINSFDPFGLCEESDMRKDVIEATSTLSSITGFAGNAWEASRFALQSTAYRGGGWYKTLWHTVAFDLQGGKFWLPEAPQWLSKLSLGTSLAGFAQDPSWGKGFTTGVSIAAQFNPYAKYMDFGIGVGDFTVDQAYKGAADKWGGDNVDIWMSDLWDNLKDLKFELPKMPSYKPGDFCLGKP